MKKEAALESLEGLLSEVEHLKTLRYGNEEYERWRNKVNVVLEAAFGNNSPEHQDFNSYMYVPCTGMSDEEEQSAYSRKLEHEGLSIKKTLDKYELLGIQSSSESASTDEPMQKPKAFISHGPETSALSRLRLFLTELGIESIVVEEQPSEGKSVDDKVEHYLEQVDCVIILATGDDGIDGKLHPRQNVIHEIGLAQTKFPDRIIYLLEEGAEFPSNIRPKVWESFTQECMEHAFIAVARELRAFNLLKSVKPSR